MSNTVGGSAGADAQTMTSSLSAVPQVLQGMATPGPSTGVLSSAATGNAATVASSGAGEPITALSSLTGVSGKGALKGAGNSVDALEGAATGLTGREASWDWPRIRPGWVWTRSVWSVWTAVVSGWTSSA
ncbi:hypothetical protein [Mycobacterium ostraviense]|uniref:Uncharacterized protein n=1 Tax=Mycobacterium ostraviense TaxID=2738409 RepID=A0A162E3D5_9MYCO|nr:hypothetical protein [Mycobacterium ostraviense]KZS65128.1 hypothetical protein A4G28_27325 [Mycobacterium ostraviense]UGT92415.1 hypothetical protein LTS72_03035 [Mycobacterium ostraviense]